LKNVLLRVGQDSLKKPPSLDKEQVEEDMDLLEMIQDLTNKLNCTHAVSLLYHITNLAFNV